MNNLITSMAIGMFAIAIGSVGVHELLAGRTTIGGAMLIIALLGVAFLIESQS